MRLPFALLALLPGSVASCAAGGSHNSADKPRRSLETLIVLNKAEATASLVAPDSGETRASLPVGSGPHEAICTPDGKLAIVCNYGEQKPGSTLTVIDVVAGTVVKTISLGEHRRPHGIAMAPDGRSVLVTSETSQKLLRIDLDSGSVASEWPTTQKGSHMVATSKRFDRAFTANVLSGSMSALELPSGSLLGVVETGAGAEGIAFHDERGEVWVSNGGAGSISVVESGPLREIAELPCPGRPLRVIFTNDGRHALAPCVEGAEIAVFDVATRQLTQRIEVAGPAPSASGPPPLPIGILLDPARPRAFISLMGANAVAELDLTTWKVVRHISVGKAPDGLAWSSVSLG
ncbi:MAG: hypothetical protein JNJ88_03045 [Planctomycetes bacterium]|nr:hypothetical protein [Planctomycetota bacterium]